MQQIVSKLKKKNKTIGFVPTMGALHKAHLSLIEKSKKQNDITVVSIFVNPLQFGPKEDYKNYPRPIINDLNLLSNTKVDFVFLPDVNEMYQKDHKTFVEVKELSKKLCGKFRPEHFKGVATVVTKLFNIVSPDRAYFGEKDYQQLKIIQQMVKDLNFPIKVVPCPTVREKDGLACSSRNQYLNENQRKYANKIFFALKKAKELIVRKKIKNIKELKKNIFKILKSIPDSKIDYFGVYDSEDFSEIKNLNQRPLLVATAVWVGKARLIDHLIINDKGYW